MKYLLVTINLFFSLLLFSQKPEDDINLKKFYASFLEKLLEEKINNFRKENGRKLLKKDSYLYSAAADQSKYNLKNRTLAHTQSSKRKANPIDRVKFYDGLHGVVAENCSKVVVGGKVKISGSGKSVVLKSYEKVVSYVFNKWKNAKGGSGLILNPNYYRVGTSAEIDAKEKTIVITQVYASTPYELPKGVQLVKDDYKIEAYNKSKCAELEKKYGYLPELMSDNIYFKNGYIYFYFHDLELLKGALKEPNDAISLDIVSRDQFSCDKGNIIYPSKTHKGILLSPISKSHIFNKNELKDDGQVDVPLCPIPEYVDTSNTEFNLLILKDNCLCQTIVYNSIGGENLKSLGLEFAIDTLAVSNNPDSLINKLTFTIPFERNKFQYEDHEIRPFLDSVNLKKFNLKEVEIIAYSSIEGDVEKNKRLQEKRANSILQTIHNYNLSEVETKILTQENWDGFYESIKGSPYEKDFIGKSKEEIRSIVNSDNLDYNIEPYLEDQRRAKVVLTVERIFLEEELIGLLPQKFNKAIERKEYVKARIYQSLLFSNIENDKISKSMVLDMKVPHLKNTITLNNNQIGFKWHYSNANNKDSLNKHLLKDIERQLLIASNNVYLQYNKLMLQLLLWTENYSRVTEPKVILKQIKLLYNRGIDSWKVNQLMLNYHLISADYYYENKKFKEREKALKLVRSLLLQSKLNRDQTYKIASYFMFQLRLDWAVDIMKPWLDKEGLSEEFLFTFLSIAIYNKKKVSELEYARLMEKAKNMNQERFCNLFGFPNMSFQLLKDLSVKEIYCQTCH